MKKSRMILRKKLQKHVKYCWQTYFKSIGALSQTFKNHIHNKVMRSESLTFSCQRTITLAGKPVWSRPRRFPLFIIWFSYKISLLSANLFNVVAVIGYIRLKCYLYHSVLSRISVAFTSTCAMSSYYMCAFVCLSAELYAMKALFPCWGGAKQTIKRHSQYNELLFVPEMAWAIQLTDLRPSEFTDFLSFCISPLSNVHWHGVNINY
jgi:hypothetical protein